MSIIGLLFLSLEPFLTPWWKCRVHASDRCSSRHSRELPRSPRARSAVSDRLHSRVFQCRRRRTALASRSSHRRTLRLHTSLVRNSFIILSLREEVLWGRITSIDRTFMLHVQTKRWWNEETFLEKYKAHICAYIPPKPHCSASTALKTKLLEHCLFFQDWSNVLDTFQISTIALSVALLSLDYWLPAALHVIIWKRRLLSPLLFKLNIFKDYTCGENRKLIFFKTIATTMFHSCMCSSLVTHYLLL